MNILDENISDSQRRQLNSWRIYVRQIGFEVGKKGMGDSEITPLLHQLTHPTFFTRDSDFYHPKLCRSYATLVTAWSILMSGEKKLQRLFVAFSGTNPSTQKRNVWALLFVCLIPA